MPDSGDLRAIFACLDALEQLAIEQDFIAVQKRYRQLIDSAWQAVHHTHSRGDVERTIQIAYERHCRQRDAEAEKARRGQGGPKPRG